MATKLLIEAIREGLHQEMERDERVMVLGEDVGKRGGVFRVTEGLLEKFGEMRVIDAPLAESSIVGVAIGAATNGMLPVAEIQFLDFIHPAMNQIMNEAAKTRYRSGGDFECPIVIRAPYGGGIHGALYHSQSIEALFTHIPGLKVLAPVDPYDAKGLLSAAIHDPDPVLFLEHKRAYRAVRADVPDELYTVPLGKAKVVREGSDMTIISYGWYLQEVLQAVDAYTQEQQATIEVIDLRSLRPLDRETILASVTKTGKVIIVHEANKFGGLGGEIAAIIAEEAFPYLDGPIVRIAGPEVPAMPYAPPLEKAFLTSADDIRQAIDRLAAY